MKAHELTSCCDRIQAVLGGVVKRPSNTTKNAFEGWHRLLQEFDTMSSEFHESIVRCGSCLVPVNCRFVVAAR